MNFSLVSLEKKHHKTIFPVKISVYKKITISEFYHGKVSRFSYLAGYFSFEKKIAHVKIMYLVVTFCTEIVTQKFVLWCFFRSKLSEKNPQFNFSSQNLSIERNLFSNEMEK